jgi:hypothetical protein
MLKPAQTIETLTPLEVVADELLRLKQAADNANAELDIAKALLRERISIGPNDPMLEVLTDESWLTVKRSGRYGQPTAEDLEALGPEVTARLFRKTASVKPNRRANWKSFLAKLDKAGIDYSKHFATEEAMQAVKGFGEEYDYLIDELPEDRAEVLRDVVSRISGANVITVRAADEKPEPKEG